MGAATAGSCRAGARGGAGLAAGKVGTKGWGGGGGVSEPPGATVNSLKTRLTPGVFLASSSMTRRSCSLATTPLRKT